MSVSPTALPRRERITLGTRPPQHDGGGCRECVGFAALPAAVPLVRTFVRARLSAWGLEAEHGWECQQVLSELVTNAFDATCAPVAEDLAVLDDPAMILVQLRVSAGHLVVEVRDTGDGRPAIPDTGLNDEGGRGLRLATLLAGRWGWYPTTAPKAGKVVWAAWPVDREHAS
ncbi:ATP-binding protein [Actinomadura sp. LOL_016]|uniref:ATP-binding protein n=1 Tax=unclassified Actinomadura TaxID=2626254 RepID=UPI003A7FFCA2